jgi:hypothetical protein
MRDPIGSCHLCKKVTTKFKFTQYKKYKKRLDVTCNECIKKISSELKGSE